MVSPGRRLGDVYVEFHADTSDVYPEAERGLRGAGERLEREEAPRIGRGVGHEFSNAMGDELERSGPEFGRRIERGVQRQVVRVTTRTRLDSDNNVISRWVTTVEKQIAKAVENDSGPSGPFGKIGQAINDAIGAGFNISGRSPLIAVLIPVFGAIALLIGSLIQGIGGWVATLTLIPGLLGAIALQAGTLFLAFKGVGTAIQGAFAAKNAEELQKALEGLTPAAQNFVKSLLPLKGIWDALQSNAQQNFFTGLGNSFTDFVNKIKAGLLSSVANIGLALGLLFNNLLNTLSSPAFSAFASMIANSTFTWVQNFSKAIDTFLLGIAQLGTTVGPFMDWFGEKFNSFIASIGTWLTALSQDKGFLNWISRAEKTISLFGDTLEGALQFILRVGEAIDRAGGNQMLVALTQTFKILADFFQSDLGQEALQGLIHLIIFLTALFIVMVAAIGLVFAAFENVAEFFRHDFLPLLENIGIAFVILVTQFVAVIWLLLKAIWDGILETVHTILDKFREFRDSFNNLVNGIADNIREFFDDLPENIGHWFMEVIRAAEEGGKNVIRAIGRGIRSGANYVKEGIDDALSTIRDYLPFSPAKTGPLSGEGDPLKAGERIANRLAVGMEMGGPELNEATSNTVSNIVFGANSIRVGFSGVVPTSDQARMTGSAVGNGILNQLAVRDTRIGVRSLNG